jgi:hypothetical protein
MGNWNLCHVSFVYYSISYSEFHCLLTINIVYIVLCILKWKSFTSPKGWAKSCLVYSYTILWHYQNSKPLHSINVCTCLFVQNGRRVILCTRSMMESVLSTEICWLFTELDIGTKLDVMGLKFRFIACFNICICIGIYTVTVWNPNQM